MQTQIKSRRRSSEYRWPWRCEQLWELFYG